jgi:hypothetical protein
MSIFSKTLMISALGMALSAVLWWANSDRRFDEFSDPDAFVAKPPAVVSAPGTADNPVRPTVDLFTDSTGNDLFREADQDLQPLQVSITGVAARPFQFGEYSLTPVAEFQVDGRVLGRLPYRTGRASDLMSVDVAIAWGALANKRRADQLNISQSNRFYFWSFESGATLSKRLVAENSANMHMIPASDEIEEQLNKLGRNDVVTIKGRLVDVEEPDGRWWYTSRSRLDTGAGACEVILVTSVVVHERA